MSTSDRGAGGANPEQDRPDGSSVDDAGAVGPSADEARADGSADDDARAAGSADDDARAAGPADDEAPDEPPIEVLRDFALPRDHAFASELRGRIERRVVAGEMVRLSTRAVLAVLLEFLSLMKPPKRDQERSDGDDVRADS